MSGGRAALRSRAPRRVYLQTQEPYLHNVSVKRAFEVIEREIDRGGAGLFRSVAVAVSLCLTRPSYLDSSSRSIRAAWNRGSTNLAFLVTAPARCSSAVVSRKGATGRLRGAAFWELRVRDVGFFMDLPIMLLAERPRPVVFSRKPFGFMLSARQI